jgi:hypothetical protein
MQKVGSVKSRLVIWTQVYQAMVQRGLRPSIATFGTLITAASDAGDLDAVQLVSASAELMSMLSTSCCHIVASSTHQGRIWSR